ncbi:MAG: 4'-phosphopantetheinyl transferase superfamily protein [Thiovulaceae bacterium]|nr:4'-phosphopantetheinyl transferase superfamily protein [Sulfurimonadaceae bacterium]
MGLYFTRELEDNALLAVWEITESEAELIEICSLPNSEKEDLQITKSESRRKERLAVRALLNNLFDGKVYLGHHDNGRPFLQNSIVEISISHTGRFAAILTHPELNVGLDLESLKRDFSIVEKKALSKKEIDDLSEKNRNTHLAIYWSAKEAIFKRMSLSNISFADQIEIKKFTLKDKGEIDAVFRFADKQKESEFELKYELFENHVMVWVVG